MTCRLGLVQLSIKTIVTFVFLEGSVPKPYRKGRQRRKKYRTVNYFTNFFAIIMVKLNMNGGEKIIDLYVSNKQLLIVCHIKVISNFSEKL